jgi:hypothetical protein
MPPFYLGTEPKHRPTAPEVDDGTGHVGIPGLVLADRAAVSEPEDLSDVVRVDQILDEDAARHGKRLHG